MDMPARHISNQSFDEILSDLGDDPAIQDPHGIRKPPPQQASSPKTSNQNKNNSFTEPLSGIQIKNLLQGFTGPIFLFVLFLTASAIAIFLVHQTRNDQSHGASEESQKQISDLKKEMALMRDEIKQDQDDLYSAIEEIEVSIHLLKEKKPEAKIFSKPQMPTHESELRHWRYLGASQMGASHRAYFYTGKSHLAFEKGVLVLGDWRLSNIEKELVTLTHQQGKSLVLKASKSE